MSPPSPYDDPVPRGWKFVQGALRVAVALQCAGAAIAEWKATDETSVLRLLKSTYAIPEELAAEFGTFAAYGLGIAALLTLMRPNWPLMLLVTLWFALTAAAPAVDDASPLVSLEQAIRISTPLVLMLVDFWPPPLSFSIGRATVSLGILRVGIIASLASRVGLLWKECGYPGDWSALVAECMHSANSAAPTDVAIVQLVALILAVDASLAFSLLISRSRPTALLLAGWQVALGALPLVAFGPDALDACLLQSAAAGAPMALGLYWICAVKEQPGIIVPGNA
jgi:hypothetical protein